MSASSHSHSQNEEGQGDQDEDDQDPDQEQQEQARQLAVDFQDADKEARLLLGERDSVSDPTPSGMAGALLVELCVTLPRSRRGCEAALSVARSLASRGAAEADAGGSLAGAYPFVLKLRVLYVFVLFVLAGLGQTFFTYSLYHQAVTVQRAHVFSLLAESGLSKLGYYF